MWRFLFALTTFALAASASAETLRISTEEYPPYNIRDNSGQPAGVYMDQLKIIFERTNIQYDASILPWARALVLAETEPMHCVVAAARTPERENHFKWVSPIHIDRNVLVAMTDRNLNVKTLDDAKAYTVGTQRTDYTEALLKSLGFPRVELSSDFDTSLLKLVAGRIDLMPMSESALRKLPRNSFSETVPLTDQTLGMACNRLVPDTLIDKMQAALDTIIADGTQRRIYEKHGLVIHP